MVPASECFATVVVSRVVTLVREAKDQNQKIRGGRVLSFFGNDIFRTRDNFLNKMSSLIDEARERQL